MRFSCGTPSRKRRFPIALRTATKSFVAVIAGAGEFASTRPSVERWSISEYGAHLRDVFIFNSRPDDGGIRAGETTGSPMYRDERVALGFYSLDTSLDVTSELAAISNLFIRTFESLPTGYERREFHLQSDNTKRGHDLVGPARRPCTKRNIISATSKRISN